MFNKTNKGDEFGIKDSETQSSSINLIGSGTTIEGDIRSNGDIRIDGTVHGHVISKAKVVIGITGLIDGDVNSQNADVSGTVKGKTTVTELLFLKSSAKISGDIITGKLVVEVGASFTGTCNMGPVIKDIKDGEKPAEQLNKENRPDDNASYMRYAAMGTQMAVIIGLGVFGGYKLDKLLELKIPVFTLLLSLLSVAAAIYLSIKDFIKKK